MNDETKNECAEKSGDEEIKENSAGCDTLDEMVEDVLGDESGNADEGTEESGEESDAGSVSEESPASETDALKAENERLKKQFDELSDRHLRTLAEYDNYRKRSAKEKDSAYADAYTDVLKQILPVIDNLERAAAYTADAPEDDKLGQGVNMTLKSFEAALKKLGIEEIDAVGCEFDPMFHNAVMHIEDENMGKNVVASVLQKGYKKGDKVIRYAMVQVAN